MIKIAYVYRCLGKFSYKIYASKKNLYVSTRNHQYLLEESPCFYVKSSCPIRISIWFPIPPKQNSYVQNCCSKIEATN